MKIATFNVNGIKSRLQNLLKWLEQQQPDIVCLQELKASQDQFPEKELSKAGYRSVFSGQRSWNGVAILARSKTIKEVRRQLPGDPSDDHSRYLEAIVEGVLVCCVYLPNGNPQPGPKFDYKLRWFERLIQHARGLYRRPNPVVIAGDFNVVPTDFDIYDPRSWRKDALLQPETRGCWDRLLAQGWIDAVRQLHADQQVFTFWDYFRQHWERNAGLRIDHLLLNKPLGVGLRAAGVDTWVRGEEKPSDHAPAWIEVDVAKKQAEAKPVKRAARA